MFIVNLILLLCYFLLAFAKENELPTCEIKHKDKIELGKYPLLFFTQTSTTFCKKKSSQPNLFTLNVKLHSL